MPNFDALRPAIVGPLAYIGLPKKKPAVLQALFQLNNSTENLADTAYTITVGSYVEGVFSDTKGATGITGVYALGSTWTIDFYTNWSGAAGTAILQLNTRTLVATTQDGVPKYMWNGSNLVTGISRNAWYHFALTCDGTSIYVYYNGTRLKTTTATASSASFTTGGHGIQNLRVVSKCLTTGSTFPIPSTLYTGYEPL